MQLVEHEAAQPAEQKRRVGARQQQRELLGRRQQNVGRIPSLPAALACGRVAGARLDADRQAHLRHRPFQIARDVDRERLQRRNVEGVEEALCPLAGEGGEARSAKPVRGLAVFGHDSPSPATPLARRPLPMGEVRLSRQLDHVGRKPASVLPAPVGAISSAERPACAAASSSI